MLRLFNIILIKSDKKDSLCHSSNFSQKLFPSAVAYDVDSHLARHNVAGHSKCNFILKGRGVLSCTGC